MSPSSAILPPQRDLFDLPDDVTFLNCSYMSPQLRSVTAAGLDAVRGKTSPWKIEAADFFRGPEALRTAAGALIGADAEAVAIVPAVSYGIAIAAANLPVGAGTNIVVLGEQFPSNVYAWHERARDAEAAIRTVTREASSGWTEAVLEAIDDSTAVVAVPNCHWTDGALLDLARIGERARAVGSALVVDASQSLGAYPIDVESVRPDFLVSVAYKWQLGPYGLGYLYVAPRWREAARPLEASWLTRAGAENFTGLVGYVDEYRPGSRRFDMGGFPQFVLVPMALAALEQLQDWGIGRVQATLRLMTDRIAAGAEALGCAVLPRDQRVGHMLGIRFPDGIPADLSTRLQAERVFVSLRGDAIRVSPHLYNDERDADRLIAVLRGSHG